jgi:hypothetical protein
MNKYYRPGFERMLDWLEGKLPEAEAQQIAADMEAADEAMRQDFLWLQSFLEMKEETKLPSPPPRVREELRRRFQDFARERRSPNLFQRLEGILSFDSQAVPATAGLRATASTESQIRQLVFMTQIAEVVINIQSNPHGQGVNLLGQVFPETSFEIDEFIVQLLKNSQDQGLRTTDELGQFAFEDVPDGIYELILIAHHFEVSLSPIQLSSG